MTTEPEWDRLHAALERINALARAQWEEAGELGLDERERALFAIGEAVADALAAEATLRGRAGGEARP